MYESVGAGSSEAICILIHEQQNIRENLNELRVFKCDLWAKHFGWLAGQSKYSEWAPSSTPT